MTDPLLQSESVNIFPVWTLLGWIYQSVIHLFEPISTSASLSYPG